MAARVYPPDPNQKSAEKSLLIPCSKPELADFGQKSITYELFEKNSLLFSLFLALLSPAGTTGVRLVWQLSAE